MSDVCWRQSTAAGSLWASAGIPSVLVEDQELSWIPSLSSCSLACHCSSSSWAVGKTSRVQTPLPNQHRTTSGQSGLCFFFHVLLDHCLFFFSCCSYVSLTVFLSGQRWCSWQPENFCGFPQQPWPSQSLYPQTWCPSFLAMLTDRNWTCWRQSCSKSETGESHILLKSAL